MSLTPEEFWATLAPLAAGRRMAATCAGVGLPLAADGTPAPAGLPAAGEARIAIEPLPAEVLGKLLTLPRLRVHLSIRGLEETAARRFLARFDQAFQRGGG